MRIPVNRVHGKPKARQETAADILADALSKRHSVVRQKTFEFGEGPEKQTLTADTALPKHKMIVEIQEKQNDKAIMAEMARERIARAHGWGVCRYTEQEIRGDIDSVLYKIDREIERRK